MLSKPGEAFYGHSLRSKILVRPGKFHPGHEMNVEWMVPRMKILEVLNDIFQEVFDNDELVVDRNTTSEDVEGWDSLTHVSLIVRVEQRFGLKFTSYQVSNLHNVGELEDLITTLQTP